MQLAAEKVLRGERAAIQNLWDTCNHDPAFESLMRGLHHTLCDTDPKHTQVSLLSGRYATPSVATFTLSLSGRWDDYGTPIRFPLIPDTPPCFTFPGLYQTDIQCLNLAQLGGALYALTWMADKLPPEQIKNVLAALRVRVAFLLNSEPGAVEDEVFNQPDYCELSREETGNKRSRGSLQLNMTFLGVADALITGLEHELCAAVKGLGQPVNVAHIVAWVRVRVSNYKESALIKDFVALATQMLATRALSRCYQLRIGTGTTPKARPVILLLSDSLLPKAPLSQRALVASEDPRDLDVLFILTARVGGVGDLLATRLVHLEDPGPLEPAPYVFRVKVGGIAWVVCDGASYPTLIDAILSLGSRRVKGCNLTQLYA